jgi:putative acetyltransferase
MEKTVRLYKSGDCEDIVKLFYNTVHTVNLKDYSLEQINAWAPEKIDIDVWERSLSKNHTVVVESKDIIVGFGDMDKTGHFNRLYVHKDFQGQGIATIIISELEKYAQLSGIVVVTTEASVTARPFFEKRGYQIIKQQTIELKGQTLTNFVMKKRFFR